MSGGKIFHQSKQFREGNEKECLQESLESAEELEPAVRLEQRIASTVQLDGMSLESQVIHHFRLKLRKANSTKDSSGWVYWSRLGTVIICSGHSRSYWSDKYFNEAVVL